MIDLPTILEGIKSITKQATTFIAQERETFSSKSIETKGLNDLVSYVDKEAEKIIVDGCRKLLPEAGFITEEGTDSTQKDTYNWIIDPLDGTTNFIHGLPVFATSIALTRKGKTILGVVHEVNRDECFYAIENEPAYCNDLVIKVSDVQNVSDGLIATGFPYYDFEEMEKYLKILNTFMQTTHGLRRMGSAAIDLAYVACGRFEGFFEYNLNSWDVAGGAFIVERAGGKVSDFSGGDNYLFGREIVAAGATHSQMLETIQKNWN